MAAHCKPECGTYQNYGPAVSHFDPAAKTKKINKYQDVLSKHPNWRM